MQDFMRLHGWSLSCFPLVLVSFVNNRLFWRDFQSICNYTVAYCHSLMVVRKCGANLLMLDEKAITEAFTSSGNSYDLQMTMFHNRSFGRQFSFIRIHRNGTFIFFELISSFIFRLSFVNSVHLKHLALFSFYV